jgi:hypothetical protein
LPSRRKFGVKEASAHKFWKEVEGGVAAEKKKSEEQKREALSKDKREATAREKARKLEEERAETRKRLELSCCGIANDRNLLSRLTKTARKAGVLGEDASFRGAFPRASIDLPTAGRLN